MEYRELGRTGWRISAISFGAWAIGGDAWGTTDDAESMRSLHRAIDLGVNFVDTADVYGDGHSERLIARLRKERSGEEIIVPPQLQPPRRVVRRRRDVQRRGLRRRARRGRGAVGARARGGEHGGAGTAVDPHFRAAV